MYYFSLLLIRPALLDLCKKLSLLRFCCELYMYVLSFATHQAKLFRSL